MWTLHSIAGVESHLVDSRSPVWIAWGSNLSFCRLGAPWLNRMTRSPNLPCGLDLHNSTRHILDKKGLALKPSLGALLCTVLHCVLCWQQASFTTSSGSLWGKVYWAPIECRHETSPQSLEQAVCVYSRTFEFCCKLLCLLITSWHFGGDRLEKKPS